MSERLLKVVREEQGATGESVLQIANFDVWIDDAHILKKINLNFPKNGITCIIGPSGGGKSTLIRSLNRINDEVDGVSTAGKIFFDGKDIHGRAIDVPVLRSKIGMVFQKPCVFPKSIRENVLFGIQHQRKLGKFEKLDIVEKNLRAASLWKEVSHRLKDRASSLSIGQQQRLCIARSLAVDPEILLLDEPTSSLDPISTRAIEEMMLKLKTNYTIVFVTHNIQQAKRIADNLIFMCNGKVIEHGKADMIFKNPSQPETKAYLNDEYCDC